MDLIGLPGASSFLGLLLLALFLELASVSRSFLSMDILLCTLEEFGIGPKKYLVQIVDELRVSEPCFIAAMAIA